MSPRLRDGPLGPPSPQEARCRPGPIVCQLSALSLRHALATVLRATLTGFDRPPEPARRSPEALKPIRWLAPAR